MFVLGQKSLANLVGVHPGLVAVVKRAIELTPLDFMVSEGVRDIERQKGLVAKGLSRTMNSKHLPQADGFSHAVDLLVVTDGRVEQKPVAYYILAKTMQDVAEELDFGLTWGCVWDRDLRDLDAGDPDVLDDDVAAYTARYKAANPGKSPLHDGPHYQVRL